MLKQPLLTPGRPLGHFLAVTSMPTNLTPYFNFSVTVEDAPDDVFLDMHVT